MSNWTPGPWGIYHGRDVTGEGFAEVRTQGVPMSDSAYINPSERERMIRILIDAKYTGAATKILAPHAVVDSIAAELADALRNAVRILEDSGIYTEVQIPRMRLALQRFDNLTNNKEQ